MSIQNDPNEIWQNRYILIDQLDDQNNFQPFTNNQIHKLPEVQDLLHHQQIECLSKYDQFIQQQYQNSIPYHKQQLLNYCFQSNYQNNPNQFINILNQDHTKNHYQSDIIEFVDKKYSKNVQKIQNNSHVEDSTGQQGYNKKLIVTIPHFIEYSKQTRKDKVRRYIIKRKKRNWNKKVFYACRKRVADSRLRIKGRFITRQQAQSILGPEILNLKLEEIKQRLQKKLSR